MSRRLRSITAPFVVAPPKGARVRTRLMVDDHDAAALRAIGAHLGSLAGEDLARRCNEGKRDAKQRAQSRRERKRDLTARSSSRWAGAITRTSEDAWQLAYRNLLAERRSLSSRVNRIRRRLALATGTGRGRIRSYATRAERFEKQSRLQVLECRLAETERRIADGRVSVCRGGRRLARTWHHRAEAGLTEAGWRERRLSATCARIRSSPSTSITGTSPAASSTPAGTRSENRRRCPSSWRDCRQARATGTFGRPSAH